MKFCRVYFIASIQIIQLTDRSLALQWMLVKIYQTKYKGKIIFIKAQIKTKGFPLTVLNEVLMDNWVMREALYDSSKKWKSFRKS